ncbi:NH3-dependent NAD+ synthetase [Pseudomonas psychrotolerans]|nr:NH3-dependent NAD+ synthetase [Pseudomonas psychrotolerans]
MTDAQQRDIIQALQVPAHFDPAEEAERRTQFLKDYLLQSRQESYVLGISGGVDSSTAGRLAQLAVGTGARGERQCPLEIHRHAPALWRSA